MIDWDPENVSVVLRAKQSIITSNEPNHTRFEFAFGDGRFMYLLVVLPDLHVVNLNVEVHRDGYGWPLFEFCCRCYKIVVRKSSFPPDDALEVAVYDEGDTINATRLVLTPTYSGCWYLSANAHPNALGDSIAFLGCWPALAVSHTNSCFLVEFSR